MKVNTTQSRGEGHRIYIEEEEGFSGDDDFSRVRVLFSCTNDEDMDGLYANTNAK